MGIIKIIGGIVAFIIVVGLGAMFMNNVILPQTAYTDMLPVHSGCTSVLSGESPYTESATLRTQALVSTYDPSYDPADDAHRFVYPAHHCIILLPLWIVPYDTGVPVWMFLNFILFAVAPLLFLIYITDYKVPPIQLILLIMISLFLWRYSMITVIFAQYTGWILACLMGAMWALKTQGNILLALFIVGLTVRTGGAFFAILILLYVLYERRYQTLLVFFGVMAALWVITLILIGPWILDFLSGLFEYTTYREDVAQWLPFRLGVVAGLIYASAMVITALTILNPAWRHGRETFIVWSLSTIPLVELIILPQTNGYTLVYALPAIFLVAYALRNNRIVLYIVLIVIAAVPWIWSLWVTTFVEGNFDQLIMPAVVMGGIALACHWGDVQVDGASSAPEIA
ncbi:MAG: hypothetical protein WBC91_26360 [Phototrophicaceae bacterium]